ncbi:MAG: hypothetical protein C5B44_05690 [Acidobacteria bacterium]|nr:MAG: hypothetical protein C5B44_05690 [Acidobacteriota bacterium]
MADLYDEWGEPLDTICAQCGCLRSEHWIGIDGYDVRNCSNADTCGCNRPPDKPTEYQAVK